MSIKRKATYNAIWLSLGSLTELIFGYFYIVILSRQLGADGLGQYYYILAIVTTITLVMNLNPPEILIKSIARQSDFVSRDMGYYLVIRFFLSILSVALILTMVFLSSRSAPFKWALIFSIPYAVTLIYGHLLEAVAKAHQDVLHLTLSRIVERLLAVGLLLVVAAAGRVSINLCILIVVFSSLIQTGYVWLFTAQYLKAHFQFSWAEMLRYFWEGSPYFLGMIFGIVYYRTDILMLGWLTTDRVVGYYGAAHQLYQICFMTMAIINAVILPPLLSLYKKDRREFFFAVKDITRYLVFFVTGMVFGLFSLSRPIIHWIFGLELDPSSGILKIFAGLLIFSYFVPFLSTLFVVIDRQGSYSWIIAATALINVGGNFILIPRYSYFGALTATMISVILCLSACVVLLDRWIRFPIPWLSVFQCLLAGLVMALYLEWGKPLLPLWGLVLSGGMTYLTVLFCLHFFTKEDTAFFKSMFRKTAFDL